MTTYFLDKIVRKFRPLPKSFVVFDGGNDIDGTIVLLHGIAASSTTWTGLIKGIDLSQYRVIAIDLLGHGRSPKPDCNYNVDDFTKSLHKTIRSLKIKQPFIIVGHSMGSIIAAHYGRLYPRQIKSEFLFSLPLYPREVNFHSRLSRQYTDAYLKAYDFLLHNKKFTIQTAQRLRSLLHLEDGIDINYDNWNVFCQSLKNTIINQDTYLDIRNTKTIPIFIIYGNMDQFLVPENIKKIGKQDNVHIKKILGADHRMTPRLYGGFISRLRDIE